MSILIEALAPITIASKTRGLQDLTPGEIIELPNHVARQVVEKARDKVRVLKPDWLSAWRELAALTYGIDEKHPRFRQVLILLDRCDSCFLSGDWNGFHEHVKQIQNLLHKKEKRI